MVSRRGETYQLRPEERNRDLIIAGIAGIYTIFMILAGGLKFILLSAVLYAPGTALYIWARREQGKTIFIASDWIIFIVTVIGAVIGIYGLATGMIAL
jgi:arginine:ornithine antiporter/lysine permease